MSTFPRETFNPRPVPQGPIGKNAAMRELLSKSERQARMVTLLERFKRMVGRS